MLNRKDVNDLLRFIPVSSKVIGYPRRQSAMHDYVKRFSENRIYAYKHTGDQIDKEQIPVIFETYQFTNDDNLFTTVLKAARVWGSNGAVIANDDYFISDVSREFIADLGLSHSVFYTIKQRKPKKYRGNIAVIGTAGANIYYHWMLDILPRLGLLEQNSSIEKIQYFVTEFAGLNFQAESLKAARIDENKIIASNDNWNFHIQVEKLWVPSLAGALGQPNSFQVNYLRSLFQNLIYQGRPFRRIYISREKTGRRMIENESDILPLLESYGFEVVHCEYMKLEEQVKLFSESTVVVGSHGSAFTNLVFCNAGTKVMEIFNETHIEPCFWFISQLRSLDYFYLQGSSVAIDNNSKNDNTVINVNLFKNLLTSIISDL